MPKMVEVEETELLANKQLTGILADVLNKPESRKLFLQAKKLARPDEPIPEIDAAKPIDDAVQGLRTEMSEFLKAQKQERQEAEDRRKLEEFNRSWDSQKSKLKAEYGWMDDGVAKVEAFAKERGIPDREAAAALYERMNPPPPPSDPVGSRWSMFEAPAGEEGKPNYMQKLLESRGESEALVEQEARAALAEIRGIARR